MKRKANRAGISLSEFARLAIIGCEIREQKEQEHTKQTNPYSLLTNYIPKTPLLLNLFHIFALEKIKQQNCLLEFLRNLSRFVGMHCAQNKDILEK